MEKIKIDGKEYALDDLSDETKNQLQAIRFTDTEIQRLQALLAVAQTARASYAKALSESLSGIQVKA
jgi:hypothetical protein